MRAVQAGEAPQVLFIDNQTSPSTIKVVSKESRESTWTLPSTAASGSEAELGTPGARLWALNSPGASSTEPSNLDGPCSGGTRFCSPVTPDVIPASRSSAPSPQRKWRPLRPRSVSIASPARSRVNSDSAQAMLSVETRRASEALLQRVAELVDSKLNGLVAMAAESLESIDVPTPTSRRSRRSTAMTSGRRSRRATSTLRSPKMSTVECLEEDAEDDDDKLADEEEDKDDFSIDYSDEEQTTEPGELSRCASHMSMSAEALMELEELVGNFMQRVTQTTNMRGLDSARSSLHPSPSRMSWSSAVDHKQSLGTPVSHRRSNFNTPDRRVTENEEEINGLRSELSATRKRLETVLGELRAERQRALTVADQSQAGRDAEEERLAASLKMWNEDMRELQFSQAREIETLAETKRLRILLRARCRELRSRERQLSERDRELAESQAAEARLLQDFRKLLAESIRTTPATSTPRGAFQCTQTPGGSTPLRLVSSTSVRQRSAPPAMTSLLLSPPLRTPTPSVAPVQVFRQYVSAFPASAIYNPQTQVRSPPTRIRSPQVLRQKAMAGSQSLPVAMSRRCMTPISMHHNFRLAESLPVP